jgi:hypothetical protein
MVSLCKMAFNDKWHKLTEWGAQRAVVPYAPFDPSCGMPDEGCPHGRGSPHDVI